MAGSTGAPGTVGCPVGARRAGGVYLLGPDDKAGKSWGPRRTPLYLFSVSHPPSGRRTLLTLILRQGHLCRFLLRALVPRERADWSYCLAQSLVLVFRLLQRLVQNWACWN